jgi:hypothetical protein
VRHINSVFHDILKLVPWPPFDRLVDEYGTDDAARRFTTRNQFLVLLFAQLGGASSLREVEAVMASHQARLYHVGAKAPKRSTLADANRNRDPRVFSKLFERMLAASPRGLRRKMGDAVRLIDSTSLHLAGAGAQWARFSSEAFGAKAHIIYDPDLGRPVYHAVTAANVNDITAAKPMPIDPGSTYVFDLGYYDFSWWARLDGAGCRLVARFKANTPLREANAAGRRIGRSGRSHRILARPSVQQAQKSDAGWGARNRRRDRNRQEAAHSHQRPRRPRPGDRPPLQNAAGKSNCSSA